ncbi:MAG: tyrosine-type recombinase/integrase [Holophagales bacterium]|nr:tyrosine-type recombinase/integrase [Holophagales bacterium]
MLFYGCGLRLGEAVHLRVTDIDGRQMLVRVAHGKGDRERWAPLPEPLLEVLRGYWREYRPKDWLFPGRVPGRPSTREAVSYFFRQVRRDVGLAKPFHPHCLRHSFGAARSRFTYEELSPKMKGDDLRFHERRPSVPPDEPTALNEERAGHGAKHKPCGLETARGRGSWEPRSGISAW